MAPFPLLLSPGHTPVNAALSGGLLRVPRGSARTGRLLLVVWPYLRIGAVSLSPVLWEMFASEVLRDPNKTKQLHVVITGLFLAVLAHAEGWTYSRGPTLSLPCRKGGSGSA